MGVGWQLGAVSHDLAQANAAFLGFPDQNGTLETLFLMPTGTPDLRPGLPLALSLRLALPRANGTTTFLDCGHPVSAAELRSERGTPPRLPPTVGRWEAGELFFRGKPCVNRLSASIHCVNKQPPATRLLPAPWIAYAVPR